MGTRFNRLRSGPIRYLIGYSITKGSLIIPKIYCLALARNWSTLDRCHGKTGQGIEKRIDGILKCHVCAPVDGV